MRIITALLCSIACAGSLLTAVPAAATVVSTSSIIASAPQAEPDFDTLIRAALDRCDADRVRCYLHDDTLAETPLANLNAHQKYRIIRKTLLTRPIKTNIEWYISPMGSLYETRVRTERQAVDQLHTYLAAGDRRMTERLLQELWYGSQNIKLLRSAKDPD